MFLQRRREVVAAVALPRRHEVQRRARFGIHRCGQRTGAGYRDGRRWQPRARIGVVGRVCHEISAAQIAVEGCTETVDHRGIGLQPHAALEPAVEHAGYAAPLLGQSGFLLDDGREYQRLVRILQDTGRPMAGPGGVEPLLEPRVRLFEDLKRRGASGEVVGVRKELSFRVGFGFAELGHDRIRIEIRSIDRVVLPQCRDQLLEPPAVHDDDLVEMNLAADELLEQRQRCAPMGNQVLARLDPGRLARQSRIGGQHVGGLQNTPLAQVACQSRERRPRRDVQPRPCLGHRQRRVQDPPAQQGRGDGGYGEPRKRCAEQNPSERPGPHGHRSPPSRLRLPTVSMRRRATSTRP